jgi:hypothetical protein
MSFSFEIKVKNASQAIAKAKSAGEANGAKFEGDNQRGNFSVKKALIELCGNYVVNADTIKITIDKKPFLVGEAIIKQEIENFFRTV